MILREFLNSIDVIIPNSLRRINEVNKPVSICGKKIPDDIDGITFGQLMQLKGISDVKSMLLVPGKVILGIEEEKLMCEDIEKLIGFANWTAAEVERIGNLFEKTSIPPTNEEKQAGIERMNFGMFGIIDYYARRMGISNHEEVESVPWVRVYKCLDMDSQRAMFERRLRKVFERKKK